MDRRSALRRMVAGSAACAATAITAPVAAAATPVAPRDALGMLYDTTRCIGCKACVTACYQANNLQPDRGTLVMAYAVANQQGETVMTWKVTHIFARRP